MKKLFFPVSLVLVFVLAFGLGYMVRRPQRSDINGDGQINLQDFSILIGDWNKSKQQH